MGITWAQKPTSATFKIKFNKCTSRRTNKKSLHRKSFLLLSYNKISIQHTHENSGRFVGRLLLILVFICFFFNVYRWRNHIQIKIKKREKIHDCQLNTNSRAFVYSNGLSVVLIIINNMKVKFDQPKAILSLCIYARFNTIYVNANTRITVDVDGFFFHSATIAMRKYHIGTKNKTITATKWNWQVENM